MIASPEDLLERRRRALAECREQGLDEEQMAKRLLEVDPDFPPGWLALGTARLKALELDAAEPLLWRAFAGAPSNPGYYFPLMALYRQRGEMPLAKCLGALALWKVSFYAKIPEGIAGALAGYLPQLGDTVRDPETYEILAVKGEEAIGEEPWPAQLLPYRLLNDVQRQAGSGLDPELIADILLNAAACVPIFRAALREAYDSTTSTLSVDAESLLIALLGEIGGVELLEDLLFPVDPDSDPYWHAQWAVRRLGQRFPAEAFAKLRAAAVDGDVDTRVAIAQHFYFLPETPGARQAILDLLDGFPDFASDPGAAILLKTVSTLMAMMDAPGDSLAVLKRHERQLSKEDRRLIGDPDLMPDFIEIGIDEMDVDAVCVDRALMAIDEEEEEFEDEEEEEFVEPEPVVKPGRNDPCWCGSGKKYKKCHLQQDEESAREERAAQDDIFGVAWRQLLEASRGYRTAADLDRAIELYADRERSTVDPKTLAETGFFEWYLMDYRAAPGGRTVAEEFLHRRGPRLPDRERALIESWAASRYGLWETQRVEAGRGVELKDLFEGDTFFVRDVSTSRTAARWDCIAGRLHFFENKWLFAGDGFLVPRELLPRVVERVKAGSAEAGMTAGAFFRSRSHEWRRFVLEEHADRMANPRLVNFEGDPIEFSSAEYEAPDADEVASVLGGAPMFEETTEAGGPRTFGWLDKADGEAPRRSFGHVEIDGGRLRLECNSRKRLATGRAIVEKLCGGLVRHLGDSFRSLDEVRKDAPPPLEPAIEHEVIAKFQAEYYAKWVDEPVPALNGRTPREAVRTKAGREAVEALLREFENSEDRVRGAGGSAFDFSVVRAALGL
jgi:hypothetical protein